jgi:hypothetical protein
MAHVTKFSHFFNLPESYTDAKDLNKEIYSLTYWFIWVRKLVSHSKGKIKTDKDKKVAEENIWTHE